MQKHTKRSTAGAIQSPGWLYRLLSISALLVLFAGCGPSSQRQDGAPQIVTIASSSLDRAKKEGVLHVGFGVWKPYTQLEGNVDEPTGLAVDLINEIATRAGLKVKFHRYRWETLKADLMRGEWDVAIEPVFITIPRSLDFGFTEPYGSFGIACAIVRKDDERFKDFKDLDQEGITVALAAGWTSSEYATSHLTKPKFQMVNVQQDNFAQLNEVLLGRADAALNDAPTVYQFAKEHADKVKALWLNTPPSAVVGGMLTRSDDQQLMNFLSNSIKSLKADGTIQRLDEKWKPLAYYEEIQLRRGAGFEQ